MNNWSKTVNGVDVAFFILELPESRLFPMRWMAWFESSAYDLSPTFFESEPSQAQIEALYL